MSLKAIALTMLRPQISSIQLKQLCEAVGGADALYDAHECLDDVLENVTPRLREIFAGCDDAMSMAEREMEFCEKHSIKVLVNGDADYPQRLSSCVDAPLVLYYRGGANLNMYRVVNVIGTRKCTPYGQDLIRSFVSDLQKNCPDVLIVSGLAYGVDIHAHRRALEFGVPTVGVLAHGLDRIYPALHRETAIRMLENGGLLAEYPSGTRPDKRNFVQRNRIVAGMSDACVLVESAAKGGGLITASISRNYGRDVFAFPGMVGAQYSEGCNNAIRDHSAHLITSASDFMRALGWNNDLMIQDARSKGIERQLFPDINDEERRVVALLETNGDLQVNSIALQLDMQISETTALLFGLEMKGVVRAMAGGWYHFINS